MPAGLRSSEASLLGLQMAVPLGGVPTVHPTGSSHDLLAHVQKEEVRAGSLVSLLISTNFIRSVRPHLTLITSLEAPSPNIVTLQIKAST